MEKNQIIRIPIKYWELINTMSDEECGKLMKCIFDWKECWLEWVTQVYYNIIMADVINLYNASNNWKKGGRPKKETTVNEVKKPGVIKKENQGLLKKKTNTIQNKVKQDKTIQDNNIISNDIKETGVSVVVEKVDNRNEDINHMQEFIKNTLIENWLMYKPWKMERMRIKNILTWKAFWDNCDLVWMTREQFVFNIINLSVKMKYAKKINNAVDLYANYSEIYNLAVKKKLEKMEEKTNSESVEVLF